MKISIYVLIFHGKLYISINSLYFPLLEEWNLQNDSKANASELLRNHEEMFYMTTDVYVYVYDL